MSRWNDGVDRFDWTEAAVARLKQLHSDGATGSEIANTLSVEFNGHVTRNAVIGKVHRLKLDRHDQRAAQQQSGRTQSRRKRVTALNESRPRLHPGNIARAAVQKRDDMKNATLPKEPPLPPITRNISLLDLIDETCRFPIGDPQKEGFSYCGVDKPADSGSPYCPYHHDLSHTGTPRRMTQEEHDRRSASAAKAFREGKTMGGRGSTPA